MSARLAMQSSMSTASGKNGKESTDESKKVTTKRPPPPKAMTRPCSHTSIFRRPMIAKCSWKFARLYQSFFAGPVRRQIHSYSENCSILCGRLEFPLAQFHFIFHFACEIE